MIETWRRRRFVAWLLLFVWLWVAGEASAQGNKDDEARMLHGAGAAAYEGGRYDEALEHFQRAYALSGRVELLYNIATAAERARQDALALEAYEKFLKAVPRAPVRDRVETRIRQLRREIERAAAAQAEKEARIAEAERAAEAARVEAERAAEAARAEAERAAEAARAEAARSEAERAAAARAEAAAPSEAGRITRDDSTDGSKPPRGVMPYVLLGAGAAVAVAGGVMLGIGLADKAQVENPPEGSRDWREDSASRDARGPALLTTGVLALPVGVLTAAAGAVWMLKTQPKNTDADPEAAGVELGLGAASVTLRGRF
jgi:hypothetical protein